MGLFEQFPYSNFHSINLDWIIEKVKTTLETAVMSVNGQTGEVILYQSENVVFPDVQSNQWRMVRTAGGHTAGVMFNDDYMYVMYDNTADRVYTMNHPQIIFPDAATRLPDVTEDYTNIRRQIVTNGTSNIVGIELKQNKAYRMKDNNRYEIYDNGNPPPYPVTSVNGETGAVILAIPFTDVEVDDVMFSNPASGHEWGIGRETTDGTATIQIITNATKAEAYIDFFDEDSQVYYTKKLLTTDDIPSSSGVVSVNGQAGVVTIYGNTIPIESGSSDSVKDVTDDLKSDIAIVEDTDTATHNITVGQYVVWKGLLHTASANISIGYTLSTSNLTAVSTGGLNELNERFVSASVDMPGTMQQKFQSIFTIISARNYPIDKSYPVILYFNGSTFYGIFTGTFNVTSGGIRFLVADETHVIFGLFRRSDNTILNIENLNKMHAGTIIEEFINGTATIPFSDFGLTSRPLELVLTPQSKIGCMTYDYASSANNIVLYGKEIDNTPFSGNVRFGYMCWQ